MSDYFLWDPSRYGLKVPEMDREHEHLVGLMNSVHSMHESGAGRAVMAKALRELVSYTRKHFADEEAYMERIAFPELRLHSGVHRQLLDKVSAFVAEFERTGALTEEFFVFLRMWLKAHICGIDAKYARQARTA